MEDNPMKFFQYEHLKSPLKEVSVQFYNMARWMLMELPKNAERTAGLRKLLEAKDCAVRAMLP